MLSTKLKIATALLLAISLMTGAGTLAHQVFGAKPWEVKQAAGPQPAAERTDRLEPGDQKQARTDRYGDPLPPGALVRLGSLRFWHGGMIDDGALSPDGKTLATAGRRMIRLWDLGTGKLGLVLNGADLPGGYGGSAKCLVAFSPDGKTLASAGASGTAFLWDAETGKEKRRLTGHEGQVHTVAFSPDGTTLATATDKGDIRFWNLDTGKEQWRLPERHDSHSLVALSPDGRSAAVYGDNAASRFCVDIYDLAAKKKLRRIKHSNLPREQIGRACFSLDGRMLATGGGDVTLRIWDAETGALLRDLSRPAPPADSEPDWVTALAFAPDGKTLAVGYSDHAIYLWDTGTGKRLRTLRGHTWFPVGLYFTPDGRTLVSVSLDGTARRWDIANGEEIPAAGAEVRHLLLARSPDGTLLATCGGVGAIHLIEAATGRMLRTLRGHGEKAYRRSDQGKVFQLAFASDGKILASAGADQAIRLWDVTTGQEVRAMKYPDGILQRPEVVDPLRSAEITALAFSPDGRILAGSNRYKRVTHIWEVASGKELRQLPFLTRSMAFLSDNKTLVTGSWWSEHPYLSLCDTASGQRQLTILIEKDQADVRSPIVEVVSASSDGRFLATGHHDKTVRIWDMALGREVRRLRGHTEVVVSVSFSPDGKWLASGSWDKTVRIWELLTGQEAYRLDGHEADVLHVAFGGDMRTLASCSRDTTALLWNLRPSPSDAPAGLDTLWVALAGGDAARAYRAIWRLADAGERAVRFLEERLRPVPEVDGQRWRKLLDQLDSNRSAEREAASGELAKLGSQIDLLLLRTVEQTRSAEVRRRVQSLLDALPQERSPEALQQSRAVQVLELLGTADARHLLKTLARGIPEARLTQEAKASLDRLAKRPTATP